MIQKCSVEELSLISKGPPTFDDPLHVGRPNIGNRVSLLNRINDLLDRRWLTNDGPFVQEFERQIADYLGVKHAIAICNATVALEIAIRALGLQGEVIVPSFTFVATAHALQWQEITPVFCDVDPATHNLDPQKLERLITPRTTGIIGVHVWGRSYDIDALEKIARQRNLKLLFDAAHAFGCSYKGQMIGGFGEAEVFSFHATKFFNTFEGGCITTNNDTLAEKIRLMRNFGFAGTDNVIYIGTNGKMSEISAAMGLSSLECLDDFIQVNYQNYKTYHQCLEDIPGISMNQYDEAERNNYQYIVLEIDEDLFCVSRDLLVQILQAENVRARRYFYPGCHQMEPYHSYYPNAGLLLTETERLSNRVMCLPTGTSVNSEIIALISQIIRFAHENAEQINKLMDTADEF